MKKEQILRWIIYIGAGLLTFLPLIVANSMYFPYITGKGFYFRIIVLLMFGAWVILALYDKEVRPQWSAVAWALAALLGVGLITSLTGVNPYDSIWSNFERMMGWIQLLHMGLLFVVLAHTFRAAQWRQLFYLSLAVSVIVGLVGLGEVGSENRVDGTLGNPIYLAMYALFHLMLAGYLLLGRVKEVLRKSAHLWMDWQVYILAAVGVLNLLALYYTKTRGAILGLLAGLFVALVLVAIFEKRHVLARRLAIGGVVVVVAAVGGFITFQDSPVVQNNSVLSRFADISTEEGTVGARLDIWALGLEGYSQRPVLGWGPGNFNYVFNTYYNPELFDEETWFDRAHNVAIEWLVAAGPAGALAYLALFVTAIYLIWRKPETGDRGQGIGVEGDFSVLEKSLLTGLVVAYLVQNLSVFDHLVSYWVLAMTLAWLHSRHIYHADAGIMATIKGWFSKEDELLSPAGKAWLSTGVGVGVVVLAVVWNYPGYAQATTLIDALRQQQNNPEQALDTYQKAIDYGAMGTQEARERLSGAAEKVADDYGATSTIAQQYFSVANEELKAQIAAEPEDLRHQVFYGQLLSAYGQHEEALAAFSQANEMGGGQKQVNLFQLAREQQVTGDTAAALESLRKAYELDTSFDEPALRYAAGAIQAGDAEMADKLLEDHFGTTTLDHGLLIQAYISVDDYDSVVSIFEKRVAENKNDPQSYVSLAAALERAGRDQEAVKTLEQAIKRFPYIEDQVSEVIRRIKAGQPVRP